MNKNRTATRSSKRKALQEQRRKKKLLTWSIWGILGALALGIMGFVVWQAVRPVPWEDVAVPPDYVNHIEEGTEPGPYPSDPPAGGVHYAGTLPAKLYNEPDLATLPANPEGYLVHNLEHGYVIFWYNCDLLDAEGCEELKGEIQQVIDEFNGTKVMAFPWKSIEVPVVATSWGKLQRFERFDTRLAQEFVEANRNKSPEPNAP